MPIFNLYNTPYICIHIILLELNLLKTKDNTLFTYLWRTKNLVFIIDLSKFFLVFGVEGVVVNSLTVLGASQPIRLTTRA